jgi:phosphatidylglycerophosphatase A
VTGMKDRLILFLATGFGLGRSPIAPGTVGSLPGVALAFALAPLSLPVRLLVAAALPLAAVPLCTRAEALLGAKDDRRIVADEYLTFPLSVAALPWAAEPWLHPVWLAAAFVVNRALDVIKPPPARGIQRLPAGLGIVLDDVVSSAYALGVNAAAYFAVTA